MRLLTHADGHGETRSLVLGTEEEIFDLQGQQLESGWLRRAASHNHVARTASGTSARR